MAVILVVLLSCACTKGDIDNDNRVTKHDSIMALSIAVGKIAPNIYQRWAGDVNNDGRINSADAALIYRMAK
jgi:hypothetical protein